VAFLYHPRADDPGGNSWNDTPHEKRNGGSVWIPGGYDPVQSLALFGPGNTYDTAPLRNQVNKPGITSDGLYLDSTLALNPDTGKLAWHFQHQANGQSDLDWAFERQVMQVPVNGVMRSVVLTGGKQMIWDLVDTETGTYVSSFDLGHDIGLQNGVMRIDPKTGAKIVDPELVPGDGQTKMICPHVTGGRDWMPRRTTRRRRSCISRCRRRAWIWCRSRKANVETCRPACAGRFAPREGPTGSTGACRRLISRPRRRCGLNASAPR
jgi:alcohol dehydrogenase (cytochrome c)